MKSSLDTHQFEADPTQRIQASEVITDLTESQGQSKITLTGKTSRAIKTRDLSSDILGVGNSLLKFQSQETNGAIVDLDLKQIPANIKEEDVKNIASVKHVISVTLDQDAIKNENIGTGRIKLRLGPNDDVDRVMLQFLKAGYCVQEHSDNPKKKSNFTTDMSLRATSP